MNFRTKDQQLNNLCNSKPKIGEAGAARLTNFGFYLICAASSIASLGVVSSAIAQTPAQIQKIAREITVRIDSQTPGSGVIVAKRGSTYYVATAKHVVESKDQYEILTYDGKRYKVDPKTIKKFPDVDLAIVSFTSDRKYRVATISRYLAPTYQRRTYNKNNQDNIVFGQTANQQQAIFVSGFPNQVDDNDPKNRYVFNPGRIIDTSGSAISDPSNRAEGYRLIYSNLTLGGMSGGAVLDANGRLIGIHGRADGRGFVGEQVVSKTLDEAKKDFRVNFGSSLGVPIATFLTLLPNTGTQLDLKIENTPPRTIPSSKLESWIPKQNADSRVNPIYWINLGNQFWRLGNLAKSQEAFDKAISVRADFPPVWLWYAKGFVAGFQQDFEAARMNCEKATQFDPKIYEAWRCKAGALYRLGKLPQALETLDRAIEINKQIGTNTKSQPRWRENPTDYTERGEILFALQRTSEAIAAFDKAVEIDPQMASAWANRAFVQIALSDLDGAETSINKALAIDPNYAPAWANRGLLLSNRKQYLESVAAFDKAVSLNDQDPEIWHNRGITLYQLGRTNDAIKSIRKALEIDPNYTPANEALKQIT